MATTLKNPDGTFKTLTPDKGHNYSLSYLNKEICEWRRIMGEKTAWVNGKVHLAKKGVATVYLNVTGTESENTQAAINFQAVLSEYTRRCLLMNVEF